MKTCGSARMVILLAFAMLALFGCGGGGGGGGGAASGGSGGAPDGGGGGVVTPPPDAPVAPVLAPFVSGFVNPLGLEDPNDGTNRLFVLEQGGTVRIVQGGSVLQSPFLDLTSIVESGGEKGLLGLAFHPGFSTNGRFYLNYTRRVGTQLQTVISEFTVSPPGANTADPASERQLLVVNQPFDNHNGGQLAFGPDGFLYIALGDGGSGGDPSGNAQNLQTLLGKILRIDVNGPFPPGSQYAIPADNPFVTQGRGEIWAYGLRNPWRFSFDLPTGRLFAADAGQDLWEEVDLVTRGGNYGWNIMEGNHCYPPGSTCSPSNFTAPITEYGQDATGGTSIIGGFVYRGLAIPGLVGTYIFGDFTSGDIWGLKEISPGSWQQTSLLTHDRTVSAFGRDSSGELYLIDYGTGAILRFVAGP